MKLLTAILALASSVTFAADHPDTSGWKDLFAADLSNAVDAAGWQFDGKELVALRLELLAWVMGASRVA